MKKLSRFFGFVVLVGVMALVALTLHKATGASASADNNHSSSLNHHHRHQNFTLSPGETKVLEFPRTRGPIQVYMGGSDGGVSSSAAVLVDPNSGLMSNTGSGVSFGQYSHPHTLMNDTGGPNGEPSVTNLSANLVISYDVCYWY